MHVSQLECDYNNRHSYTRGWRLIANTNYTFRSTNIHLHVHVYAHVHVHVHVYTCMYTCIHTCTYMYTCYIYMYMYIVVVEKTSSHNRLVAACAADVAVSGPACGACIHGQPNEA